MPGKDGTGPLGMGPMTGRAMGFCGKPVRGAWGFSRGRGRGYWPYGGYAADTPEQEKERLADMERTLTEQLAEVKRMQEQLADRDQK